MRVYVEDIAAQVDELVESILAEDNVVGVTADELGLDYRAGNGCDLFVVGDCTAVAVLGSVKHLEYYGGFECVHRSQVTQVGGLTIYSGNNTRVDQHIQNYLAKVWK